MKVAVCNGLIKKIVMIIKKHIDVDGIENQIRKGGVLSEKEASYKADMLLENVVMRILIILFLSVVLIIASIFKDQKNNKRIFQRGDYGDEAYEKEIEAQMDETNEKFSVDIKPREYTESEIIQVFEEGFEIISKEYLGENSGPENICKNMNLLDHIDALGLDVRWTSSDYEILDSSGRVVEKVLDEPETVVLTAEIWYMDFSDKREYQVVVEGKTPDKTQQVINGIREYIEKLQAENPSDQKVKIPEYINGIKIRMPDEKSGVLKIFVISILMIGIVIFSEFYRLSEKRKNRDDMLAYLYPEFIDKLSLYMGAGLSIKGSMIRIAESMYQSNPLKDEIQYTLNEISSGGAETKAYVNLGHRLGGKEYLKITNLLAQNIKSGTKNMVKLMEDEKNQALAMRKEYAKRKGEEASTKLLFPMIILLVIVMAMIMVPALMSF